MLPNGAVAEPVNLEHAVGAVCPASPLPTRRQVLWVHHTAWGCSLSTQHPASSIPSAAQPSAMASAWGTSESGGEGVAAGGQTHPCYGFGSQNDV